MFADLLLHVIMRTTGMFIGAAAGGL